jgi:hypothetical protein
MNLGCKVKDKITGFTGIVTGFVQYITGCNQALVQPVCDAGGKYVDSQWLDEQRLDVLPDAPIALDNGKTPGADKPAPHR